MHCSSHYNMSEAIECMTYGRCSKHETKKEIPVANTNKQIEREFDFLTQPGGGDHPGWKFRPLYEAFVRLFEVKPSKNKKYIVELGSKSGAIIRLEVSPKEAKRLKELMRKKFFFARKELYICTIGDNIRGRLKVNLSEYPVFNLLEVNIETNPLEDASHYEDPGN